MCGGFILTANPTRPKLFHRITDNEKSSYSPVNESTLGVHQVELVVQSCPGFCYGSCVAQHANSALDFNQITTWHYCEGLVVDPDLEASWTPIHKLKVLYQSPYLSFIVITLIRKLLIVNLLKQSSMIYKVKSEQNTTT